MKTRIFFSIILVLFLFEKVFSQKIEMGKPFFRYYSPKEMDSETQIWAITQGKNGLMYFSAFNEVIEYDGVSFQKIKNKNNTVIRCLLVDENGVIYVGCVGDFGFLYPNENGSLKYHSLCKDLDSTQRNFTDIWNISNFNDTIYFRAKNIMFAFPTIKSLPKERILFKTYSFSEKNINFFTEIEGEKYFQLTKTGLCRFKNNSLTTIISYEELGKKIINKIILLQNRKWLIAQQYEGLLLYSPSASKKIEIIQSPVNEILIKNKLYFALETSENHIFSHFSGGTILCDLQQNILQNISKQVFSHLESVWFLHQHSQNEPLWLGTNKGILKTETYSPIRYWDKESGISGAIQDVIRYKNILYLATTNGIYFSKNVQNDISSFQKINTVNEQAWNFLIFNISQNEQKLLVVANNFLYEIVDTTARKVIEIPGGHRGVIKKSEPNAIYLSKLSEILRVKYENGKWITKRIALIRDEIRTLAFDENENLWAGTLYKGIYRISKVSQFPDSFKVSYFDTINGLPASTKNRVFAFKNTFLAGTQKGLYFFDEKTQTFKPDLRFGKYFFEKNIEISRFLEDKENIWIFTKKKMLRLIKKDSTYIIDSLVFKRIPDMSIYSFFADSNFVFAGGNDGLFRFDTKIQRNFAQKYHCLIRKVALNKDSILFNGTIFQWKKDSLIIPSEIFCEKNIDFQHNSVIFEFASPFFDDEAATQYSYFLENFDKKWSNFSKETKKEYTNLPEGKYSFKVKAKNIYEIESLVATYTFEISPPWYRTIFAYIFYFFLTLGVFYLGIKFYAKRLEQRNRELEKIVDERTAEIRLQNQQLLMFNAEILQQKEEIQTQAEQLFVVNDKLSQQNEKIEFQNEQIKASIRYALKIQHSILPNIKKIQQFFETFILFKPKDIVSGDFYWFSKQKNYIFVVVGDCTGHGVPGAFMSMIANRLLSEGINEKQIINPRDILEFLHLGVLSSLQNEDSKVDDGMDLSLCRFEILENNEISVVFSGAKNAIFIFEQKNQKISVIKASRKSIGGNALHRNAAEFENQEFILKKNDMIYFASDGFIDQNNFGRKRFGTQKFIEILEKNANLSLSEQQTLLEQELLNFQQNEEQRDDITVLGMKL